jgi:hypothetical protein
MKRRSLFLSLAAGLVSALLVGLSAPAQAGIVDVITDSGGGTVDVDGTAAGADITNFNTQLTEINGSSLSPNLPLSFTTLHVVFSGGVFSGTGTKTIGSGSNEAVLTFSITSGSVSSQFFNLTGVITGVTPPGQVTSGSNTYDFSDMFPGGGIVLSMNKTSGDFAAALNHPGTNVTAAGFGLQQSVAGVPEPASLALLGIGMTGFLAFRRLFKKTSVA